MEKYTLVWLLIGGALCLMELFVPTAFVELAMGTAALLVAVVSLVVPKLSVQIFLWMVFSLLLIWLVKRLLPKKTPYLIAESTEATTLTEIAPGQPGRVMFEGNSWQARCDGDWTIPANRTAIVVGRKGNTLLVVPEDFTQS
ncbi:NfeD family protein [Baaleninema sp.]|uniref:NfeD family protein n=1 Tax=Baaleninema sp. TaxID=3101197 RepID=UPI003D00166B